MFKDLFSLFKQNKSEEAGPSEELSPEEKIRSQYEIRKRTYADGHIVFRVESSIDYISPFKTFKTLEEARKFLDNKVKARLADHLVNSEVVE